MEWMMQYKQYMNRDTHMSSTGSLLSTEWGEFDRLAVSGPGAVGETVRLVEEVKEGGGRPAGCSGGVALQEERRKLHLTRIHAVY